MRAKIVALLVIAGLSIILVSCNSGNTPDKPTGKQVITIIDIAGRQVTVPEPVERVVALSFIHGDKRAQCSGRNG